MSITAGIVNPAGPVKAGGWAVWGLWWPVCSGDADGGAGGVGGGVCGGSGRCGVSQAELG